MKSRPKYDFNIPRRSHLVLD